MHSTMLITANRKQTPRAYHNSPRGAIPTPTIHEG